MIVSIKLCLDVRNDEYIILCNFGDRTTSGFEVIERGLLGSPPVAASEKKPSLNRVRVNDWLPEVECILGRHNDKSGAPEKLYQYHKYYR